MMRIQKNISEIFTAWKKTLVGFLVALICLFLFNFFPSNGPVQDFTRLLFVFGIIPALFIVFVLKERLENFGLRFPTDKKSLSWFLLMSFLSLILTYFIIHFTPFKENYALPRYAIDSFWWFLLYELVFINIWFFFYEAFFKGFFLFILAEKLKTVSIIISALAINLFIFYAGAFSWSSVPIMILSFTGSFLAYKNRSFIHSYLMGLLFIIAIDTYMIYVIKQYF